MPITCNKGSEGGRKVPRSKLSCKSEISCSMPELNYINSLTVRYKPKYVYLYHIRAIEIGNQCKICFLDRKITPNY